MILNLFISSFLHTIEFNKGFVGESFLLFNSAKNSAMGESYIADCSNNFILNPSCMNYIDENLKINFGHYFYLLKTSISSLNVGFKTSEDNISLGFGVYYFDGGVIYITDNLGRYTNEETHMYDYLFSIACGFKFDFGLESIQYFDVGLSLKYFNSKLYHNASNTLFDVSLISPVFLRYFKLGIIFLNNGSRIRYYNEEEKVVNFRIISLEYSDKKISLTTDYFFTNNNTIGSYSFGLNYKLFEGLNLYLGYNNRMKLGKLNDFSFGFGVYISNLTFDYAFIPIGELENTHKFNLGIKIL